MNHMGRRVSRRDSGVWCGVCRRHSHAHPMYIRVVTRLWHAVCAMRIGAYAWRIGRRPIAAPTKNNAISQWIYGAYRKNNPNPLNCVSMLKFQKSLKIDHFISLPHKSSWHEFCGLPRYIIIDMAVIQSLSFSTLKIEFNR